MRTVFPRAFVRNGNSAPKEREMDTCGRGVKESFIISLSLSSTKNY